MPSSKASSRASSRDTSRVRFSDGSPRETGTKTKQNPEPEPLMKAGIPEGGDSITQPPEEPPGRSLQEVTMNSLEVLNREALDLVKTAFRRMASTPRPLPASDQRKAVKELNDVVAKIKVMYEDFSSATSVLQNRYPEERVKLGQGLEFFHSWTTQQLRELERANEDLRFHDGIPPPGTEGARVLRKGADGVLRTVHVAMEAEELAELARTGQAMPTRPISPLSFSSSSSPLEFALAEAEAEAEITDEIARLEEQELRAELELKLLAVDKKRLSSHGKVRILERKAATERSLSGSLASGDHLTEGANRAPRHPDIMEKIVTHGPEETKVWLKVQDFTEDQIDEIFREVQEDNGHKARALLREDWASPKAPILRSGTSRSYGNKQERRVARTEEGPWPGSNVRFKSCEPSVEEGTTATLDTARILMRDKIITGGDVFKGDKSKFRGFWNRFQQDCTEVSLSDSDKIRALWARTDGKPREIVELITECHPDQKGKALKKITDTLFQRFGSSSELAADIRKDIESLQVIKSSDPTTILQNLSDKVFRWSYVMEHVPELADLNTSSGLDPIRKTLPIDLQRKWQAAGHQYKEKHGDHPPFSYFVEFLEKQAKMQADPHFRISYVNRGGEKEKGSRALTQKDKDGKDTVSSSRTLRTETSQPQASRGAGKEGEATTKTRGPAPSDRPVRNPGERRDEGRGPTGASVQGPAAEAAKECILHGSGSHGSEACFLLKKIRELPPDIRKAVVDGTE